MALRSAVVSALVLIPGLATATPAAGRWQLDGGGDGPATLRQVLPATSTANGLARSRTIYLNRTGATLTPGANNSQANTSSIVPRLSHVPGWNANDNDWAATLSCMQQMWSRFDVTITDVDPGATPHIEAVFARSPADIGITDYIGGVSPFTSNCSVIESSIVFAFADNLGGRPRLLCEVMSQEIAHSYGLDHELAAADPMSYLPYRGNREFQDVDAACGETTARPCGIAGSTCRASQNSVALLRARIGVSNRDNQAPSVGITAPADSATVAAGFAITVAASDNTAVASVAFYVDGALVATRSQAPYALDTDPGMSPGSHTIEVEATDADGNTSSAVHEVMIEGGAGPFAVGCTAGARSGGLLAPLFAALALVRTARRSRRRRCPR